MGPGYWVPTPPAFIQNPLEPACGLWKPWVLPTGDAIRPGPPPAYGGDEFNAQLDEVWQVNQTLTAERLAIALYWAAGSGTVTPPGMWNQIATGLAADYGLNEPQAVRVLAYLGIAQADAFISCWDCKYHYWCVRPVTEVRAVYDADWLSPIATPPFPSYPSGHSTTSGAAAAMLAYFFPNDAVELQRMGLEAMSSRLYGGIHFTFDDFIGYNMGTAIATRTIKIAGSDGAPKVAPGAYASATP